MKIIKRKCVICGETITIKVYDDGSYEGGHYFGKMVIPKSFPVEMDENHPNYAGEDEEYIYFEYWECNSCYNAWDRE